MTDMLILSKDKKSSSDSMAERFCVHIQLGLIAFFSIIAYLFYL